jgi:hypothetical protein
MLALCYQHLKAWGSTPSGNSSWSLRRSDTVEFCKRKSSMLPISTFYMLPLKLRLAPAAPRSKTLPPSSLLFAISHPLRGCETKNTYMEPSPMVEWGSIRECGTGNCTRITLNHLNHGNSRTQARIVNKLRLKLNKSLLSYYVSLSSASKLAGNIRQLANCSNRK